MKIHSIVVVNKLGSRSDQIRVSAIGYTKNDESEHHLGGTEFSVRGRSIDVKKRILEIAHDLAAEFKVPMSRVAIVGPFLYKHTSQI